MHVALTLLGLVAVVGFVAAGSRRVGASEPLVLVVVGVAVSYLPKLPDLELRPDVVLTGLLPPLLYAASIRTSLVDFRANKRPIILLSLGLVAFSTVAVGFVTYWTLPGITLAAGFALGAVVAPPDAVAASTVAKRVGIPRRLVAILEGESLLNDATALVALNTAIAALSGTVTPVHVGLDFLRAAGGGILIGTAAAMLLAAIRRYITDPVLDTTLSFAAPWVAFLPAEELKASGVLAVVVTGLYLGHRSPIIQTAASRIAENTNWRTVQFLLENVVFLLIGLQLRGLLHAVRHEHLAVATIMGVCAAAFASTVVARAVWIFASVGAIKLLRGTPWPNSYSIVVSWAGMRGVVTLAAVFLIPAHTPHLAVLRLAAFTVVAGTLLVQGLTLPFVVRRLQLAGPDAAEDALQAAGLVTAAAHAGLAVLDEIRSDDDPEEVIDELRRRAEQRSNRIWEQLGRAQSELEPPGATYRRLRINMLAAERSSILEARDRGVYDDEVLRAALNAIDLEESLLDRIEDASARVEDELTTNRLRAGDCEHLRDAPRVAVARTPKGCEECLRDGTRWVHLRMCLACGHVGCCDSSVGKHAELHYTETAHPVMRSIEPGEAWRWCYVDELLG